MSILALYVLDLFGKPLISRNYRGAHDPNIINKFILTMMEKEYEQSLTPVIQMDDVTFAFTKYNNVYLVATVNNNANISLVFVFLHKFANIVSDYFVSIEEESVKDNFIVIYELMDEVIDFGYPQTMDSQILKKYILNESKKLEPQRKIPPAVTNAVSWRSEGIKYKRNEVFLDVIESVDLLANGSGIVTRSEIIGTVTMMSKLSGMPEMQLGLNDRLVVVNDNNSHQPDKSVDLDGVKFHQCVRLSRFESNRSISFIPPDGEFELMSYRIDSYVKPPIWVDCVTEYYQNTRIEYTVKATSNFRSRLSASFVDILIPVPSDVDSPMFKAAFGVVRYIPEKNVLKWSLKSFSGLKEVSMRATFKLPSVANEEQEQLPPIQVEFEILLFAISGIHVEHMKVMDKSGYKSVTWVRYVTKNGDYQIRQREVLHKSCQNNK